MPTPSAAQSRYDILSQINCEIWHTPTLPDPLPPSMTYQQLILPELRCIASRFIGPGTWQDLTRASELLWTNPAYDRSYDGIMDLTRAQIAVNTSDIPAMVSFYRNSSTSTGRWAVIVTDPKSTAFSLLFKTAAVAQPWIEIFASWENASRFLHTDLSPAAFDRPDTETMEFGDALDAHP